MSPKITINIDDIGRVVGADIEKAIKDLVVGTVEDIQVFAIEIGKSMVLAQTKPTQEQRDERMAELKGQLRTLAEIKRVQVNALGWDWLNRALDLTGNVLGTVLAGLIVAV